MDQHAVIVVDTSGVITEWNHAAGTLFGYGADEAVGQSLDLVVAEPWREAHWAGFHRAMKGSRSKAFSVDLPVRCADHKVRNVAGRLVILSDGMGVAVGAMAIFSSAGSPGVRPCA